MESRVVSTILLSLFKNIAHKAIILKTMSEQYHARKTNKRKKTTRKTSATKKQSALSALLAIRMQHGGWAALP